MRLIGADALFKAFENAAWYNNADRDDVAEELLLDAPTIDAVPVVRCKDCIFHQSCIHEQHLGLNGFCSYGERGDENELKPCPFCGGEARICSAGFEATYIRCANIKDCGCKFEWFDTEEEAIEAWNRRADNG